ncbi:hypothetical protein LINGRAPRIM_LOCUS3449, partial [Linum grandiflorum]
SDKKSKEQKENVKRNVSALRIIQQAVSKTIFPRIFGIKTAKEAWEVLKNEFQGSEKEISIKCQNLWRQFDNLAMKEGESIKDFHSRVAEIVNQIKVTGATIDEKKIVERILRSLTPKFEHVVAVIEETKDLAKLSMTELMGSLVAHEQRLSRFNNQPLEQAFQSKVDIKGDSSTTAEGAISNEKEGSRISRRTTIGARINTIRATPTMGAKLAKNLTMQQKTADSGARGAKSKITPNEIAGSRIKKKKTNQALHKRRKKNLLHFLASKTSKKHIFHGWWTADAATT